MRVKKSAVAGVLALATLLVSTPAFPLASGSVVFDPTNWAENGITSAKSIAAVAKQAEQYVVQVKQWENEIKQLQNFKPEVVLGLLAKNSVEMKNAVELLGAVNKLYGSVSTVQENFSSRLQTAKALGMTWQSYTKYEEGRIVRNQDQAMVKAKEEIRAMERVKQDYEFAREIEAKIPETAGMHESMTLMNTQLNRMITQNAAVIQALNTAAGGRTAEAIGQQNEADTIKRLAMERRGRVAEAIKEGEDEAVKLLKAAGAGADK